MALEDINNEILADGDKVSFDYQNNTLEGEIKIVTKDEEEKYYISHMNIMILTDFVQNIVKNA